MVLRNEELTIEWMNKNIPEFKDLPLKLVKDNPYSSWDIYNDKVVGELKHRRMPYSLYAKDGYILEKYKFNKLVERAKSNEETILYINTFDDKTLVWWNLSKLIDEKYDFYWHNMSMKKTTDFEDNSQIDKLICKLSDKIVHYKTKRKDM